MVSATLEGIEFEPIAGRKIGTGVSQGNGGETSVFGGKIIYCTRWLYDSYNNSPLRRLRPVHLIRYRSHTVLLVADLEP